MYETATKESVRRLRKKGYTFNEILEKLPFLSKSTISEWVRDIELNPNQERRILEKQLNGRKRLMEYNKRKRKEAIEMAQRIILKAKEEIGKINKRDLMIAGATLYWAEGRTKSRNIIEVTNSDPKIIVLMMRFFREICKIRETRFRGRLTLHPGLNQKEALSFWSALTKIPPNQFHKVYTKPPKSSTRKMHNILYKGTFRIVICDTENLCRIKGFIAALSG